MKPSLHFLNILYFVGVACELAFNIGPSSVDWQCIWMRSCIHSCPWDRLEGRLRIGLLDDIMSYDTDVIASRSITKDSIGTVPIL
jgi:hypothetical protein